MSRFDSRPAPELIESAYWFETNDAPLLHHDLTLADAAHLLHVSELDLIPRPAAQTLLRLIFELDRDQEFAYDPALGDAFTNREHWISRRAPEAAGYLSAGRARREATTVAFRLLLRRELIGLARSVSELELSLLDLASRHVETVMPDYTYLQQAHPTTFAHYLLSFFDPLRRDALRIRRAFDLVNQSPAGIGSTNGSRFPLNRERLAEMLAFDAVIVHARDAMWQVDAPLEAVGAAATLIVDLDRLAEDLQIFNTAEFAFVELAENLVRGSVIMPQKKNPYPLAFIRGAASVLLGRVTEMYAIARTPSAQVDNRIFAHGAVPRALELTERSIRLMTGVLKTLRVNSGRMRGAVETGFTQATDLAELLMQECHLDFRTSHELVSGVVRKLTEAKQTLHELTPELLDAAARETIGQPLQFSGSKLKEALDPDALVAARSGTGGASPLRVREMIETGRPEVATQRTWAEETGERVMSAEARLIESASEFSK